jgi:hypothetical protein
MTALRSIPAMPALALLAQALAPLGLASALPAQAATTDPEQIVYRIPGLINIPSGGSGLGFTSVIHCVNFSGDTETVRIVIRSADGTLIANQAFTLPHLQNMSVANATQFAYTTTFMPATAHGMATIAATSVSIVCSAVVLDVFTSSGTALHMIRLNPAPGTLE